MNPIDFYFGFLLDAARIVIVLLLLTVVFALGRSLGQCGANSIIPPGDCLSCLQPLAAPDHPSYCSPQCMKDHHDETAWFAEQAAEEVWERRRGNRVSGCEVCGGRIFVPDDEWSGRHNCGSANCAYR